ncbi:hypothetical protein GCM10009809_05720 [Isoptericola hypogeus]|uniref:PDZ domain-containing protein n=1 Tax=Isoptericola hypogeus TaxID=300179 RepID=A0ABP4UUV2_9MICO
MTQRPDDERPGPDPARPDDLFAPPEPPAAAAGSRAGAPERLAPASPFGPVAPGEDDPAAAGTEHAGGGASVPPFTTPAPSATLAPARPRARRLGAGVVALAVVAGLVGGFLGDRLSEATGDDRPADAALPVPADGVAQGAGAPVSRPAGSVARLAADALPSVVSIEVSGGEGVATGSGFVLRADGYILTNDHVVAGSTSGGKVVVTFSDGREREAEVVGRTTDYDLAVLKVDEKGLEPLVLGDSDDVVVGDSVLAVGAPLGLDATVTTGIVSALHRPVQAGSEATTAFIDAIQTDAAINPGNSGGPLIDAEGEVVGINSAIAQPPGAVSATGSIGLGFAIPANQARHTAEQLIESGNATYPVIGVLLDTAYAGEGVQVSTEAQQGQPAVTPEGPADLAGIRSGDVILAIDGRPVSRSDELIVAIRARQPGDAVTLRVRADGAERDVRVVLQAQESG